MIFATRDKNPLDLGVPTSDSRAARHRDDWESTGSSDVSDGKETENRYEWVTSPQLPSGKLT